MSSYECQALINNLRRLPNEILFKILYLCSREYLPENLIHDNYFMRRWYQEYYPTYYQLWKKEKGIQYVVEGRKLIKKINGITISHYDLPHIDKDNDRDNNEDDNVEIYNSNKYNICKYENGVMLVFNNYQIVHNDSINHNQGRDIYIRSLDKRLLVKKRRQQPYWLWVRISIIYDLDTEQVLHVAIFAPVIFIRLKYLRDGVDFVEGAQIKKIPATQQNLKDIVDSFPLIRDMIKTEPLDKFYFYSLY